VKIDGPDRVEHCTFPDVAARVLRQHAARGDAVTLNRAAAMRVADLLDASDGSAPRHLVKLWMFILIAFEGGLLLHALMTICGLSSASTVEHASAYVASDLTDFLLFGCPTLLIVLFVRRTRE
jgi:hypothetical protein